MNDTDDPDTDIAIEIRRKEACRTAIESMGRIRRTPRNIQLLHDLVDEINELRPESVIGHYRIWPSGQVNRLTAGWNLTGEDVKGKTRYGGWDPERDTYMRINEDGDFEGLDQTGADDSSGTIGKTSSPQRPGPPSAWPASIVSNEWRTWTTIPYATRRPT